MLEQIKITKEKSSFWKVSINLTNLWLYWTRKKKEHSNYQNQEWKETYHCPYENFFEDYLWEFCEWLYSNKSANLLEMDKFTET